MAVKMNGNYLGSFLNPYEISAMQAQVNAVHEMLHNGTGLGNDYLGWITLPTDYDKDEFARIQKAAKKIQQDSDILIVIGIGGSYLGARAAIELLRSPLYNSLKKDTPDIYFVGNNISSTYISEILSICEGKDISVNVISKSGTTTEPALAFRIFRELLEKKYGREGAKSRIYCTTDKARGTLKSFADKEGYETFVIPDDVGGRYSVLTPVGLLPIAVSGADIEEIMAGAREAQNNLMDPNLEKNDAYRYAVVRNILNRKGKQIELMVCYETAFTMMNEWYKQLFGESEGKDHKGLFPASVIFSTDLHSMGQYIQQGSRNIFETVVHFESPVRDIDIKEDAENIDGLNFLAGKTVSYVNQKAFEGTLLAHTEGGVPNIILEVPKINEHEFGYLIYFFEKAVSISGYLLGINPFDQPGVEGYKNNMYALLGKPGYEELRGELEKKLHQ